jgi:hypothetical protein
MQAGDESRNSRRYYVNQSGPLIGSSLGESGDFGAKKYPQNEDFLISWM